MIPALPFSFRGPGKWMLAITLVASFTGGMTVGGNAVAAGEPPADMYETAMDDMLTEDGRLAEQPAEGPQKPMVNENPPLAESMQDRIDAMMTEPIIKAPEWVSRALEGAIAIPMLKLAFRVADVGYGVGYWLASVAGVGLVRFIGNVVPIGILGIAGWQTFVNVRRFNHADAAA